MQISVRGRHHHVPEDLQEFATHKMEHLGKYLSTIDSIDVELYEDGKGHKPVTNVVHVTVHAGGTVFRSKVASGEPKAGIDIALQRLERRVKEFKRMRSGKPAHAKPKGPAVPAIAEQDEGDRDS